MLAINKNGHIVQISRISSDSWLVSSTKKNEPSFRFTEQNKAETKFFQLSGITVQEAGRYDNTRTGV